MYPYITSSQGLNEYIFFRFYNIIYIILSDFTFIEEPLRAYTFYCLFCRAFTRTVQYARQQHFIITIIM